MHVSSKSGQCLCDIDDKCRGNVSACDILMRKIKFEVLLDYGIYAVNDV